jgi:hypothetical protein
MQNAIRQLAIGGLVSSYMRQRVCVPTRSWSQTLLSRWVRINLSTNSTTSSARASNEGGTVRPKAFAVLRLMTSSTLVLCWTGRSTDLAPLRILPACIPILAIHVYEARGPSLISPKTPLERASYSAERFSSHGQLDRIDQLTDAAASWNAWRRDPTRPNLSGANLSRQDLDGRDPGRMGLASFHRAGLCGPIPDDVQG